MTAIDEAVLRVAWRPARAWRDAGRHGLRVSVNVSDAGFRRPTLPDFVEAVLAECGVTPDALELELTEAIVTDDIEHSIATMQRIRRPGVALSIDDFGTGCPSPAHLERPPIQVLKIDRPFVAEVVVDPNDAAITEAVVAMAHETGISVVAGGAETEARLDMLRRCGCGAARTG